MDILLNSVFIGIGLAMDCLAISLAIGASRSAGRLKTAIILASFFGFFQFGMVILGWLAGSTFAHLISAYDHWVAFLLLLVIGIKMIHEGLENDGDRPALRVLSLAAVTVLAVATSIDALAVGITYAVLAIIPFISAGIIGIIAFVTTWIGFFSGSWCAPLVGNRVDIAGGLILILIGVRVLLEHNAFF